MSDISLSSIIRVDEDTSTTFGLRELLAQAGYTTTAALTVSDILTELPDGEYAEGDAPLLGLADGETLYVRPGAWQQDWHGTFTSYQLVVAGDNGDLVTLELRVVVDPVNDAPTAADHAFTLATRDPLVLDRDAFGFRDPVEGDAFKSVIVTSLPAAGTLVLDGHALAAGAEVAVADIDAGRLAFVPGTAGAGLVEVGFRVRDTGGTAGTGAQDTSGTFHLTFDVPAPTPTPGDTGGSQPPATGAPQLARIGDTVWEDMDGDGIQDAGEAGLAGVTVALRDGAGNTVATTTTDAAGHYQFETGAGTYTVAVGAPAGYAFSAAGAGGDRTVDSDVDAGGVTAAFTVAKGDVVDGADAGLYRGAAVAGTVWNDANRSGVRGAGEAGIASVKVTLVGAGGHAVASAVTDAQGGYQFAGLRPGTYSVQYDKASLPAGFAFSGDGGATQLTLVSGQQASVQAAAYAPTGTLASTVWEDRNGNGVQDAGEAGVAGAKVTLVDAKGVAVATATTDARGNYSFTAAAGDYAVRVEKPAGTQFTAAHAGGNDALDSDVDAAGVSATFTLRAGQTIDAADAGIYRTASLGNRVWYDCDGDGIQDSGESGIANARVTLLDKDGKALATTTTDGNGQYAFTGLKPGTYSVQFDKSALPAGYTITQRDAGGDDTRDSDIDANGLSQQVVLASGDVNTSLDAGVAQAAKIRSTVWEDSDFDGVQDSGEAGIGGVTVRLYDASHTLKATTVTAADGGYQFANLAAGSYSVEVTRATGWYSTKANVGNDSLDSDFTSVGTSTAASSGVFRLAAGETNTGIDAGLYRKASIGDKVWRDGNHNGVQDAGEEGIGKIKVMLYNASTGALLGTTTTDAKGSYLFNNLDPGSYYLKFDKTGVMFTDSKGYTYAMNDWKWGVKNTGSNDLVDSDVKGDGISKVGLTQTDATTLTSGENDMSWDAAITPIALDLDGDGIHTIARADFRGTFDLLGTGTAIRSGWLSAGDAFLALDANGNGRIDGIAELFGGTSKGSGFARLASFDSNGDGRVDGADARFGELSVWRDANGNGVTDAGELVSLADAGVTSLAVAYEELPFVDAAGNLHLERSSAVVDGRAVAMTDVYFSVAAADAAAAGIAAPTIAELVGQAAPL